MWYCKRRAICHIENDLARGDFIFFGNGCYMDVNKEEALGDDEKGKAKSSGADVKKKQLAQALRHNLRRRKAQPDMDCAVKES